MSPPSSPRGRIHSRTTSLQINIVGRGQARRLDSRTAANGIDEHVGPEVRRRGVVEQQRELDAVDQEQARQRAGYKPTADSDVGCANGVRVCASHLEFSARGEMRLDFPFFRETCEHGCATCKPAVLELLNAERAPSVFVGDGLSDRYAAACSDLVFAKNALAQYCREQDIEHVAYERLREVASRLDSILDSTEPVGSLAALPATA